MLEKLPHSDERPSLRTLLVVGSHADATSNMPDFTGKAFPQLHLPQIGGGMCSWYS